MVRLRWGRRSESKNLSTGLTLLVVRVGKLRPHSDTNPLEGDPTSSVPNGLSGDIGSFAPFIYERATINGAVRVSGRDTRAMGRFTSV